MRRVAGVYSKITVAGIYLSVPRLQPIRLDGQIDRRRARARIGLTFPKSGYTGAGELRRPGVRENIAQVYGGCKGHEFMAGAPEAAAKRGKKWNSKQFLVRCE